MFPYVHQDTKMGGTAGYGIAVAPPQPRGLGAEIEFQLHLYCSGVSEFRKPTYRLANVPRGVTLYESHLSEVTGLGRTATESILSLMAGKSNLTGF